MKKLLFILIMMCAYSLSYAQFVAKMEVKEKIEGLCDRDAVYALFPMFDGQEEAVCPMTDAEILSRLNNEVGFLKDNPKYKDKGMIGLVINCEGKVVKCKMDNKTKSKELDKQIEHVFSTLGEWKAGKLNNKAVDSSKLYSFKIKKGRFVFE
ncbi:MAG: hypothetical protein N4A71_27310 [Carboxylicivirga sp.]|jgi:hypothetical protein|nr:hypothetical protein [Carboxylicivirga sp.]